MTKIVLLVSIIFLSSCTTGSITFQNLYESIKPLVYPDRTIPEKYNESFPYSYASVRVGRGPIIYVVLSTVNNQTLRWISSDGFEIFTINGKIIKSTGFEKNINYVNPAPILALSNIKEINNLITIHSKDHYPFNTYMNLRRSIKDNLIIEDFNAAEIKWRGRNFYYLDEKGRVVRSITEINPLLPKVEMNFYKLHVNH